MYDDIILTRDSLEEIEGQKKNLATKFEVNNMGQLQFFLRMKIVRSIRGTNISQRKHIIDLLTEMNILGCKLSNIAIEIRKKSKDMRK